MANSPAVTFRSLLCADSEQQLPDNDAIKALQEYGALFKKTKIHAPERLDLLAGLMWVHAHKEDLHVVWSAASSATHTGHARGTRDDARRSLVTSAPS